MKVSAGTALAPANARAPVLRPAIVARPLAEVPPAEHPARPRTDPVLSLLGNDVVEGNVVQRDGPMEAEAPRDPWKSGCALLALAALFPVMLIVWALLFALRLALSMLGIGSAGGGRGILSELFYYRFMDSLLRRPEKVPVHVYVVQTEAGQQLVRQEGNFDDGHVFVNHRVRFHGKRRGGALIATGGYNLTLGTRLSQRRGPWRLFFVLLLALVVVEYMVIAGSGCGHGR